MLSLDKGVAERRPPSAQNRTRSKFDFEFSKSEVKIGQAKAKDEHDMMMNITPGKFESNPDHRSKPKKSNINLNKSRTNDKK